MTDGPEKIWAHYENETDDAQWVDSPDTDGVEDFEHYGEYTRTDVANARIEELEAALGEFARFASRKDKNGASVPFGQSKLHAARAVLKGEDT